MGHAAQPHAAGVAEAMGKRRITLFSRRGQSLDDAGVRGMGLLAGKGMYAGRSPREGFRPLMEEGVARILDGSTSIAEVARSVDLTQRFH